MQHSHITRFNPKVIFLFLVVAVSYLTGCAHKQKVDERMHMSVKLNKAITVIEERHAYELEIIKEEKYAISVLEQNIDQSNSDGMKDKLRDEIKFKNAVIAKAKKNIANQNKILEELNSKRDSILSLIEH